MGFEFENRFWLFSFLTIKKILYIQIQIHLLSNPQAPKLIDPKNSVRFADTQAASPPKAALISPKIRTLRIQE